MKKSTSFLIGGIIMIIVAYVLDTIVSKFVLSFTDISAFGMEHYLSIIISALLLVGGIIFIVLSRRIAKKERDS